jgi:hypothetical protein
MSVSSMANLAFARRSDVEPEGEGLKTRAAVAAAKEGPRSALSSAVTPALPSSPLERYSWFTAGLAGVVALVLSMLIGLFAPIFSSNALASK